MPAVADREELVHNRYSLDNALLRDQIARYGLFSIPTIYHVFPPESAGIYALAVSSHVERFVVFTSLADSARSRVFNTFRSGSVQVVSFLFNIGRCACVCAAICGVLWSLPPRPLSFPGVVGVQGAGAV